MPQHSIAFADGWRGDSIRHSKLSGQSCTAGITIGLGKEVPERAIRIRASVPYLEIAGDQQAGI